MSSGTRCDDLRAGVLDEVQQLRLLGGVERCLERGTARMPPASPRAVQKSCRYLPDSRVASDRSWALVRGVGSEPRAEKSVMTSRQYAALYTHIHLRSVIGRFHVVTMERRRREASALSGQPPEVGDDLCQYPEGTNQDGAVNHRGANQPRQGIHAAS